MDEQELEAELDQLFQLHPSELVPARNALADRLRKAGDKARAARVKQLAKPTASAWALNRLHAEQPALLERARDAAEAVRTLHADPALDAAKLRQAMADQRAAVAAVVQAAERSWAAADLPGGLAQQRKLLATVQGWLAGVSEEQPGRMTRDLEAGGFDGVQVVAASAPTRAPIAAVAATQVHAAVVAQTTKDAEIARARELVSREETRAVQARERVRRSRDERAAAERELEGLKARIQEVERTLAALMQSRQRAEVKLSEHGHKLADAEQLEAEAEKALAGARLALESTLTPSQAGEAG